MRYWPGLIFLILSFSALANRTVQTRIHEIDLGKKSEDALILLESGDVAKLSNKADKDLILSLHNAKYSQAWLNITVDDERFITSIQSTPAPYGEVSDELTPMDDDVTYMPTVLSSYAEANTIFKSLNSAYRRDSQCYNRAQVWSYESLKRYNLKSMKAFLFFTRKYIRDYNYHWWFHVTPYTYVNENGYAVAKVLDYRFIYNPINMKSWTDIFMHNDATCPEVQRYSDYSQNQYSQYCYLYKTSMYYYQPLDLERLERSGTIKTNWVSWEVNNAYKQGFGRW